MSLGDLLFSQTSNPILMAAVRDCLTPVLNKSVKNPFLSLFLSYFVWLPFGVFQLKVIFPLCLLLLYCLAAVLSISVKNHIFFVFFLSYPRSLAVTFVIREY